MVRTDYPTIRVSSKRWKTAESIQSRETQGILFVRTVIRSDIMRFSDTVRLPIDREVRNKPLAEMQAA